MKTIKTKTNKVHNKMSEKRLDLLSIYAGLDITYPAQDQKGVSICQAISSFFKNAENTLIFLQPQRNSEYKQALFFKRSEPFGVALQHLSEIESPYV